MAKKKSAKKRDIDIDAQIGDAKISIDKNENETSIDIDTKKVDIKVEKTDENSSFVLDTDKLDVEVHKTADNTTINVSAKNKFLKWIGNMLGKLVAKRKKK